jgi:hypothetical protein
MIDPVAPGEEIEIEIEIGFSVEKGSTRRNKNIERDSRETC